MIRTRQILAQHEKPVTDPDFKNILLECLPHSWNPFVLAMLAQEMITKMTITELKTTLSEEYQRCKRQDQTGDTTYSVTMTPVSQSKKKCSICS